jgi:HemY protein
MKPGRRVLAAGGAAAALGLGAWVWSARSPAVPAAQLPPAAQTDGRPAALAERIREAETRARRRGGTAEDVAELGRLYHANGYTRAAAACWEALRRAQPDTALWAYLLADLRATEGDAEAFETLLRDAVRLAPDYAPARLKLADLAFKTGRLDEARSHYEERLRRLPGDAHARLGLARILALAGDTAAADDAIAALVRDHPDFPPGHNLLAERLAARGDEAGARRHRWLGRESGRFREAEDPWLRGLHAWCLDPQRLAVLGTTEFQLASGDKGRALIERAVSLAPDDPGARELLGDLYLKLGEAALARDTLAEALRLRAARNEAPPAETYVNLVEAWQRLGRADEALRTLDDGFARLGAGRFELHLARGVVLDGLERLDEAEAALREAVRLGGNDSDAHYNLALVLLQRERRAEAAGHLRAALERQPTFPKALALLAQLEMEAGRLEEAGTFVIPLFDANPGQPEVQALTAFWYLQRGLAAAARSPTEAEPLYRAGLEAQPDNVDLLVSLGALLVRQQRPAEAEIPLREYRRLRPAEAQSAMLLGEAALQRGQRDEAVRLLTEGEQLALRAGQTQIARRCRELLGR